MSKPVSFITSVLLAVAAPEAFATATYSYASTQPMNQVSGFYPAGGTVSASMTLPTALPANTTIDVSGRVVAFSFSDGQQTLTQDNAFVVPNGCLLTTDAAGQVVEWTCRVYGNDARGAQLGDPIALVGTQFVSQTIFEVGAQNIACDSIVGNVCGFSAPGEFGAVADSASTGLRPNVTAAPWRVSIATAVPALDRRMLLLLAGLSGLLAAWRFRYVRQRAH